MMFQAAETGSMSTEDKTKHNGIEEAKQQNKSSHGNEVKYFTHCNTTISIFYPFNFAINGLPSKGKNDSLNQSFINITFAFKRTIRREKAVFSNRNCLSPKVIEYSNTETLEAWRPTDIELSATHAIKFIQNDLLRLYFTPGFQAISFPLV